MRLTRFNRADLETAFCFTVIAIGAGLTMLVVLALFGGLLYLVSG